MGWRWVAWLLVLFTSSVAWGQTTGQLRVTVVDGTETAVADVQLKLTGDMLIGGAQERVADPFGQFLFTELPPGIYRLTAEKSGFQSVRTEGIEVLLSRTTQVTVRMSTGSAIEEVVVVQQPKRAVDVESTSRSQVLTREFLQRVPAGRSYQSPTTMAAGVQAGASAPPEWNREQYDHIAENGFHTVDDEPLSTFSVDVDTASYSNVRRFLDQGHLPPPGAVRVEELINYFRYEEPAGEHPISVTTEVADCPWNPDHRLLHVGIQGMRIADEEVPPRNLVFLLDVSGSMQSPDKLPMLKAAFPMLIESLRPQDRVAIVVYAGASGVVLPPTPADDKVQLRAALEMLEAGGSTAGAQGIRRAYQVARKHFYP